MADRMAQAQVLDDSRLLIHWRPPETLARPHRHHSALLLGQAGGGGFLMVYDTRAARVERLFASQSPELAAW